MAMIRQTTAAPLTDWVARALASGDRDLTNLAARLRSDAAAVRAALTEPRRNGPVEGQVGRLKGIKRPMSGHAGMQLLRARVRHKG
jgi:transposase